MKQAKWIFKNRAAGGVWADFDTDVRHDNPVQGKQGAARFLIRSCDQAIRFLKGTPYEQAGGRPSSEQNGVSELKSFKR